jgi:hypothetical protein
VSGHVGLLFDKPPGSAGLPFIESSDDAQNQNLLEFVIHSDHRTMSLSILPPRAGIARRFPRVFA